MMYNVPKSYALSDIEKRNESTFSQRKYQKAILERGYLIWVLKNGQDANKHG